LSFKAARVYSKGSKEEGKIRGGGRKDKGRRKERKG